MQNLYSAKASRREYPNLMNSCLKLVVSVAVFHLLASCGVDSEDHYMLQENPLMVPAIDASEQFPGGETTSHSITKASFISPISNISDSVKTDFYAGRALAQQPWIKAPTITNARDGLGPLYNARTCLACHANGGRGKAPRDNSEVLLSTLVRLSIPGYDEMYGVIPEPHYGDQIQSQSIALSHQLRTFVTAEQLKHKEVAAEAYPYLTWQESTFVYPDGKVVGLSQPKVKLNQLAYGKLHPETLIALRVSPPLLGLGLLEAIEQVTIEELVDPNDENKDGISGRINKVWDFQLNKAVPGRFGLKANRPNLLNLTAAAFANDIGISNPLFPDQSCTKFQSLCNATPNGNDAEKGLPADTGHPAVELSHSLLKLATDFVSQIAVPVKRGHNEPNVQEGRNKFYATGCQSCHQPSYVTGKSNNKALSEQKIWPYSDLLLHDMGPALADGRADYLATGSEWRTAPLWGVGLTKEVNGNQNFLHDGRAETIEQAILWHGGEAELVKQRFVQLSNKERLQLIAFVESL